MERIATKQGGYEKVIYGHVVAFARQKDNTSVGIFFENFTTKEYPFKLFSNDLYSEKEQMLLDSLMVKPGVGGTNVIMVLDEDLNVLLVKNAI